MGLEICLSSAPKTATAPHALPSDFTVFIRLLSKCINCAIWMQTDKTSCKFVVELKSISFHKLPAFCSPLNRKTKQTKNTNMRRQRKESYQEILPTKHYVLFGFFFLNISNSYLNTVPNNLRPKVKSYCFFSMAF